jgi:hypothetical protein
MHPFHWKDVRIQLGTLLGVLALVVGGFYYIDQSAQSAVTADIAVAPEPFPSGPVTPPFYSPSPSASPYIASPSPSPSVGVSPSPTPTEIADLPVALTLYDQEDGNGNPVPATGVTVEVMNYSKTKSLGSCTTTVSQASPYAGTCDVLDVPGPEPVWVYLYDNEVAHNSSIVPFGLAVAHAQPALGPILHNLPPKYRRYTDPQTLAKEAWQLFQKDVQRKDKTGTLNVQVSGLGLGVKAKVTVKPVNGRGNGQSQSVTGNGTAKFKVKAGKRYIVTVTASGYQPYTSSAILVPDKPPVNHPVRMRK